VLSPLDIQKKEFRRAFRGYSNEEVDSFLDRINQDYEEVYRENQVLKEKLAQAEQNMARYREIEEVLKNTMVMAQKNAEELQRNAEKEAGFLLERARSEAGQLIREAEERVKELDREYRRLKKEAQVFLVRLRASLQAQIELLSHEEETIGVAHEKSSADPVAPDPESKSAAD